VQVDESFNPSRTGCSNTIFISHLPELININPFSGCLQLQLPVPCKAMSCPFLEHPQSYAVATALSHQNAQIPLIKSSIIIWPASNPSAIHLIIWWLSKGWERWNEAPNISYQSFCNAGFNITASSGALIGLISLVYASDYAYFPKKNLCYQPRNTHNFESNSHIKSCVCVLPAWESDIRNLVMEDMDLFFSD